MCRRLDADSVALLFGTRDPAAGGDLAGLPALVLEGLVDADARALLASVIPGRLDERVRDRIIAESGGNPLALLELPHGVTAAEWAGGFGVAGPAPLTGRIEQSFQRPIAPLPEATRCLLLLAATEPTGDPTLLWRAAGRLGISTDAADPAEAERLLTVADRVTFRPPSSARPSIRRRQPSTAAWPTMPSPRLPTREPIPTAGPGIRPKRHRGPMRTSPPSSSGPLAAHRRAAGLRRPPPFSNDLPP